MRHKRCFPAGEEEDSCTPLCAAGTGLVSISHKKLSQRGSITPPKPPREKEGRNSKVSILATSLRLSRCPSPRKGCLMCVRRISVLPAALPDTCFLPSSTPVCLCLMSQARVHLRPFAPAVPSPQMVSPPPNPPTTQD